MKYKNTDLFLKIGGKSIIIENKLKSLPDKNQLERYDKKLSKAYLEGRYGAIPIFQSFTYDKED